MRKYIACSLLLLIAYLPVNAAIDPDFTKSQFAFNGMQHLRGYGFLVIGEEKGKSTCRLTLIDYDLNEKWSVPFSYSTAKKRSEPLDVQVLSDDQYVYWISKGKAVHYAKINAVSGDMVLPEQKIAKSDKLNLDFLDFIVRANKLYLIDNQRGNISVHSVNDDGSLNNSPVAITSPDFDAPRQFACEIDGLICTYAYQVDKRHARLEINMTLHDVNGELKQSKDIVLRSKGFSFTYNSFYDKNLLTISKLDNNLLIFGKLDYQFDKGYVDKPDESAFVGFWTAKVQMDLSDFTFNEFPFSELGQVVPSGTISRYVMVDLKEDENGDIYFNFTVQPVVFDPLTYIFQLTSNLDLYHANKGKIERSFFDYNKFGVRNFARSNNIILRTDIWRYQSTVFLPKITNSEDGNSRAVEAIKQLHAGKRDIHPQDKIYTLTAYKNEVFIMEYTKENNGTLRIYKAYR